ncbi:hypothetical protein MVEN_01162800 [Mycena venus]|uniref:Uncharacterized protein n=1 Tax=Mycena venus TaxID=2733690 RepID=A0A8H6Y4E7_9AGAR|nr:hypothetical protein MVEN_01162800 [Mycena venus]
MPSFGVVCLGFLRAASTKQQGAALFRHPSCIMWESLQKLFTKYTHIDCHSGLEEALEVFKVDNAIQTLNDIDGMRLLMENMHNELLDLASELSDETSSERSSSVYHLANASLNSSNSFSMLPSSPKIFYGRDSELEDIIQTLARPAPRVAILGGGWNGCATSCLDYHNARHGKTCKGLLDPTMLTSPQTLVG